MNDTDVNFVVNAKTRVYLWLQGLDSDMFSKVPENIVFKKLDEKRKVRVQKALDDIQKSMQEVANIEEMMAPEEEEAAAPKVKKSKKNKKQIEASISE